MNGSQPELADDFTPRNNQQHSSNRLPLIIFSLLITLGTGSWLWREIQLHAAQQLIQDCIETQNNCGDNLNAVEQLVKAKKSLQFFNLESAHLENAHLEHANLKSAHLESAHLEHAHLENVHLENANLSATQMSDAHLENAHLEHVNLSHAHLEHANLYLANLQGAYISHNHLQGAHLNRANLQGTHFYDADFEYTYFHLANLSHTHFYRANFDHANLYRANLDGAHLIEAQNLTNAQIKSACNWSKAIYKGVWSPHQSKWVVDEKANQQFIQQLQHERKSDPKQPVDCSEWE